MTRRVVYTALFGEYETLIEQPVSRQSAADFICFTDVPGVTSDTWQIVQVEPIIRWDPSRSVRFPKIIGHEVLAEYDETMWIDNRILLKRKPERLFDAWLREKDIAFIRHDHRKTVRDEYMAVIANRLDDASRVREQLHFMTLHAPEVLDEVPLWGAVILRRRSDAVRDAMSTWLYQVLRHSRRDQLSLNYAIRRSGIAVNVCEVSNWESDWHRWIPTSELPKNDKLRFSTGYKYPIHMLVSDRLRSSRAVRHLRWRLAQARIARKQ